MSNESTTFQALKKRQDEVEAIRRKQEEERKKREDFDREGRHQVHFSHILDRLFGLCFSP